MCSCIDGWNELCAVVAESLGYAEKQTMVGRLLEEAVREVNS